MITQSSLPTLQVEHPSPRLVLQLSFVHRVLRKSGLPDGDALIATADDLPEPLILPLDGDGLEVGREKSPKAIASIPGLSRRHFQVTREEDGYRLKDLGAKNRVWRNAKAVEGSVAIHNGDVISAGDLQFVVYLPEAPPEKSENL